MMIMADLENVYACSLSDSFASPSFATILRHIGNTHDSDYNLQINCPIHGCLRSYTNFESFRSHVYRKHCSLLDRAKQNALSESISPNGSPTRGKLNQTAAWSYILSYNMPYIYYYSVRCSIAHRLVAIQYYIYIYVIFSRCQYLLESKVAMLQDVYKHACMRK